METYTKLAYPANKPKKAGEYDTDLGLLKYSEIYEHYGDECFHDGDLELHPTYFFEPIEPTSLPLLGVKEVDHERLVEIVMKEMLKLRPLSPKLYLTTEEIAESIVTALLKELGLKN